MQKHFVTFYSPGTFVAEETIKDIASWDVDAAMKMAHGIVERYAATPYAFRFSTRERGNKDLDSKTTKTSCLYHLGGKVETLAEVEARNDPKEKILLINMRNNGYDKIVVNDNSWRSVHPLGKDDVVLDWKPKKPRKRRLPDWQNSQMANPPMTDNDIAAVVKAAVIGERERCAKIASDEQYEDVLGPQESAWNEACARIANTIRNQKD